MLPGIMALVSVRPVVDGFATSGSIASTVRAVASQFQQKASNVRSVNPALSKALAINQERKRKALLHEQKEAVKIAASLWEIPARQSKMIIARIVICQSEVSYQILLDVLSSRTSALQLHAAQLKMPGQPLMTFLVRSRTNFPDTDPLQ